jgi:hypothetical protein
MYICGLAFLARPGLQDETQVLQEKSRTCLARSHSETKLGHQELEDMLRTPLHHGAYLLEVDPQRLLGPNLSELRQLHRAAMLLGEVRNLHVEYLHDAVENVLVGVVCIAVMHVVLLAMCNPVPCNEPALLGKADVCTIAPADAAAATANPTPLGAAEVAQGHANP